MSSQEAKLIARIAENLPELDRTTAQGWIDNPKALQRALRVALCPPESFPTWAHIRLGGYESPENLISELEEQGIHVLRWAQDIAGKTAMSAEQELKLVAPTVRELGFTEPTRFNEVCARARKHGLELVPQDAALYAALQAGEQVGHGELYIFAMLSITDSVGVRLVFDLYRYPDGELELNAFFGVPDRWLRPEHRVVFSRT